ncbi:cofactor assembly of complex C subunit B [Prochlorococcus sp. AH-716-D22]|nr:cofactor assembly of complex C subunit B [Prochlorococcus sp. AH-716-D22]
MNFNGKTLIIIGSILFLFQLGNFFSIDSISPALERAQVLSALSSVIIVLIGFLFKQFNPNLNDNVELKGENKFIYEPDIPRDILDELAWGSETILTSTAAATVLIHNNGKNILTRGITTNDVFTPGETCLRSLRDMKLISLANTKFYPGRDEFYSLCPNVPSILIIPINSKSFILLGGWSYRCFTKSDEKWISNWSKKVNNIFIRNSF